MNVDLEHLSALDTIDRELDQLDQGLKAARDARQATSADLASLALAAAKLRGDRDASLARQKDAEVRIKGHRDRMRSAKQALETGVGNYQVAERQIEEYTRLMDADETVILEELDAQDRLASALADNERLAAAAKAKLADLDAKQPELDTTTAARRLELQAERATHLGALPLDLQNRYTALRGRGKRAIAKIVDGACGACSQHVQDQQRIEIHRGRIEVCRGCHRWLVVA